MKMLKIVNPLLFISAVAQVLTGAGFAFHLFAAKSSLLKWVLEIHKYNGFLLAMLIIVHVTLNWSWIKSQFLKKRAA